MKTRTQTAHRAADQAGFTLYELLITVLIVGMVLSFGLANFSDFARNGRMTTEANDLLSAFHLARSEAARAKTNITICASADGADCGGTWDQGYIVFTDTGIDVAVDGTDVILRRHDALADGITVSVNNANAADYFSYAATGLGRGNVAGPALSQVVLCDERGNVAGAGGNSTARAFVVTPLGRGVVLRTEGQVQTVITAIGAACP